MPGAQATSAAEKVAEQMDRQGWHSDVFCSASSCHHPNALHLQEMPCSAAGLIGEIWTRGTIRAGTIRAGTKVQVSV